MSPEHAKIRLGMSNDDVWHKTSNPRITQETMGGEIKYRINFNVYPRPSSKAKRMKPSQRYDSRSDAEAAIFNERFRKESACGKEKVMNVLNRTHTEIPKIKISATDPSDSRPKKKRYTMMSDLKSRTGILPNRNPSSVGDLNPHGLLARKNAATAIASWISKQSGKNKQLRPLNPSSQQEHDMKVLKYALNSDKWFLLIPYGEDEEVQATASTADKSRAIEQGKLVLKALQLYNDKERNQPSSKPPYTWRQACEDSVRTMVSNRSGRTVERWYVEFRNNGDMIRRFPLSRSGKDKNRLKCPFVPHSPDNQSGFEYTDVIIDFEKWFRDEQMHMTAAKAAKYYEKVIREKQIAHPDFLSEYKINLPLSKHVAASWMKAMGCEYSAVRKMYYVEKHESEKAKLQRKKYISHNFTVELREMCWLQFTHQELESFAKKNIDLHGTLNDTVKWLKAKCERSKLVNGI